MNEIARAAGVSRQAVAAALNKSHGTTKVSENVRRRVLEIAESMLYIPNNSAKALVSGKTHNVGLILGGYWLTDEFSNVFDKHGYLILPFAHEGDPAREKHSLEVLLSRGVDAIIISRTDPKKNIPIMLRAIEEGIKLIILAEEKEGFPESRHVFFDERKGMSLPINFLLQNGVRRFGLPAPPPGYSPRMRLQYAREALEKAGNEVEIVPCPELNTREQAVECARFISALSVSKRPQAVVTNGDGAAWLLIEALREIGLSVPEDIMLTGVGNDDDRFHLLPLTTVVLSKQKMAEACYEAFEDALNGREKKVYVIEPKLFIRESAPGKRT